VDYSNRSKSKPLRKPSKPYPDFPLFPHANGHWAKKIRGKLHYFGRWADWQAALDLYQAQRDDLHAGRTPRASRDGLTVSDLCNRFLTGKQALLDNGELSPRTFQDYHRIARVLVDFFGRERFVDDLVADDFGALRKSLAERLGPVAIGNEIQRIRTLFKFAFDDGLIDKPVRYGANFNRPTKRVLRAQRHEAGPRMFEADEIHAILKEAKSPAVRAMVLLGVNCGLGNHDCGRLPLPAVDLDGGWINFPRPKTAVMRRCPLWPETVEAIREALAARPMPADEESAELVFLTYRGRPWSLDVPGSPISKETRKILNRLKIVRPGTGFYALRHTFETIGGGSKDQISVDAIMGHADDSMAANYRERIDDQRLIDVVNHVRDWLFGASDDEKPKGKAPSKSKSSSTKGKSTKKKSKSKGPSAADSSDDRPRFRIVG
jgi:integrase